MGWECRGYGKRRSQKNLRKVSRESHLKTLKSRYTGYEDADKENLSSTIMKNKHIEGRKQANTMSNTHSSNDDDEIQSLSRLVSKSRRRRRLPDGKPYGGGAGRMTKMMEHKLAEHYGLAIRQSSELAKDLNENDAVILIERNCRGAFLHNMKQSDRELQHALCPKGPESWCSYQKDKYLSPNEKTDPVKDHKRLDA
ncbi:unnamed protein product, partial [Didymodactylos carnosus]